MEWYEKLKKKIYRKILKFAGIKEKYWKRHQFCEEKLIKLKQELKECPKEFHKKLSEKDVIIQKYKKMLPEKDQDKLQAWSKRIRQIGKCDICESVENLTAHHLWDKNRHPTLMYQDENGVCLCLDCHNAFHKHYNQATQTTPAMYQKFKILKRRGLV